MNIHTSIVAAMLAALLLATSQTSRSHDADTSAPSMQTQRLMSFEAGDHPPPEVVNDGVMGGRSQGFASVSDGVLRFDGELVTRGGGFSSVRLNRSMDLTGYQGIVARVRGNGRLFQLEVSDRLAYRGRPISRRLSFPTSSQWQWIHIPFDQLQASIFGQRVRAEPLDPGQLVRLGFFIADGVDGEFWLEIDSLYAYRMSD